MRDNVRGEPGAVVVRPTTDMDAIRELGVASGLDDSERGNEHVRAAWGAYDGERLVGGIALERYEGYETVNWMAVDGGYRRRGIASRLLEALEAEARTRRIGRLWVTARNPAFFLASGYGPAPDAESRALLADCAGCEQFRHGCDPQALTKLLRADADREKRYDGADDRSGGGACE